MAFPNHELVHFNLAVGRAPLDHPSMRGFVGQVDEVNRLAAASPGFVWGAAEGEAGDAVAVFESPLVLANISTWRSLEDLRRFVYEGVHGSALARRNEWFEKSRGAAYVLWWTQAGHRPNWMEAKQRLDELEARGPTPNAFTFGTPFDPASAGDPVESRPAPTGT